jgi:FtsH-binding integral membrane protein
LLVCTCAANSDVDDWLAYRWLAVRWLRLALLAYGLLMLLVISGTIVGTDVVYGVVIFCVPLVLYHIIRQRQRMASAKSSPMEGDKE